MSSTQQDVIDAAEVDLASWLEKHYPATKTVVSKPRQQKPNMWTNIRLFLSSSFIDTHGERDVIIKRVIPNINRKLAPRFIRFIPVDLRWGVSSEESKDCRAIQKTCLDRIETRTNQLGF